ncbi:MAG TPA: PAS domain-containing protein [Candidatus Sulfotelmatobacter sp.]|nr:PAS domain-containing protein [Candidatus Sulfotelmatobacter sp.]
MSKLRTSAWAIAALLISVHLSILLTHYGSENASVWGDWIDTITPLAAAVICWLVSQRTGPFGKRVWRLVSLSALLTSIGQGLYTYNYDYQHAPLGTLWPSDFLVFFWIVPAVMTLFLSARGSDSGLEWLRIFDFVQVCILALVVELTQVYVPSRWAVAGQSMQVRALHAGILFYGLIAASFLVRGLLSGNRNEKAFFLRMGGFLVVYGTVLNVTLSAQASGHYEQGKWLDLIWTVSTCVLIVLPATWSEDAIRPVPETGSSTFQMVALFSPLIIPAIVFPLLLSVAQEQFMLSVVLVLVSFIAAGGRMFVVQRQLVIRSQELQKNINLLGGITEGTTDAVFVKDLQGKYLMINSAGAGFVGKSIDQILGKTDRELFSADTAGAIMEMDRKVMVQGLTQTYEERGTSNGVSRLYLATKGPYRDAHGEIIGLLGISRDITERKQAEEEIRQSQQKLGIHFQHTPLAVVEWDLDFRVAAWNPSAERIFGYSRQEALGQHARFIVPTQYWPQVDQVWQALLHQKGGARSTNDNLTKDGRTISCEWYNTPLVDESGKVLGVASLVQDVTERVALEDRLRQSQKMEAVGRLAGGVAHDFNNLLTVIIGYSQILADGLPAGSRLAESTAQIKAAADRAAGITRQLLAFSRKTVLSPHVISLNDIVLNLDSLLRRLIGEDIEVITVPAQDLGSVKADPSQIEQVVLNLALNARDAMPHGGKLTVETSNATLDGRYSREHKSVEPGRYVMLAVSDTGEGMSEETQARIFEPFYTTKEVGKGTGLGLSMVYGIVKQSGGHIWVYSEPGRGSTFKIYFPRTDAPAEILEPEKHVSKVQRGTETILLVEDDEQLRELSSSVLTNCGYNVLVASSPEQGLTICKANADEIRLLVTDVVMPRINGRQLAEQVLKFHPQMKVLYISGYTNNAIVHYGVLDPGLWFLPKPFTLSELVAKVREVLDATSEPTAAVSR